MKIKAITNVVVTYTEEEYPQLKELLFSLGYKIFGGEELEFPFKSHNCILISDDDLFQNFHTDLLILPWPILTFEEFKNNIKTIMGEYNKELNEFMNQFPTHESVDEYLISRGYDLDELKNDFEEIKRKHKLKILRE